SPTGQAATLPLQFARISHSFLLWIYDPARNKEVSMQAPPNAPIVVCALYKFVALPDYADFRQSLLNIMEQQKVRGTLLLAKEGINGTIAGSRKGIDFVLNWLRRDSRLADLDCKESYTDT